MGGEASEVDFDAAETNDFGLLHGSAGPRGGW